jgi:RNA polymerase sigma-70 factor (ECF subfamily)
MQPTDIELMLRVRSGDVAAFRELVERYRGPLWRFFAAVLEDRSRADDFVQETFLRLWLARERYEPTGRFSTYLFQIGKHYWQNQRPKLGREISLDGCSPELIIEPSGATQPETVLLERYRQARVRRAVAMLPGHYRAVIELNHFEGLTYAEVAGRLGIPVGTVKSRMAEAVRRLRRSLVNGNEGEDSP